MKKYMVKYSILIELKNINNIFWEAEMPIIIKFLYNIQSLWAFILGNKKKLFKKIYISVFDK